MSPARHAGRRAGVPKPVAEALLRHWTTALARDEHHVAHGARRDRGGLEPWQWAKAGALFETGGNVVDYAAIERQVKADAEIIDVQGLAIDRWNATGTAIRLQEDGCPVVMFGQGYASMSAPAKEWERLVMALRLDHGGHPVLRGMAMRLHDRLMDRDGYGLSVRDTAQVMTGHVLNPTDWAAIEVTKDSQGRYIWANPAGTAIGFGRPVRRMRLASDDTGALQLQLSRTGSVSLELIEAP